MKLYIYFSLLLLQFQEDKNLVLLTIVQTCCH